MRPNFNLFLQMISQTGLFAMTFLLGAVFASLLRQDVPAARAFAWIAAVFLVLGGSVEVLYVVRTRKAATR